MFSYWFVIDPMEWVQSLASGSTGQKGIITRNTGFYHEYWFLAGSTFIGLSGLFWPLKRRYRVWTRNKSWCMALIGSCYQNSVLGNSPIVPAARYWSAVLLSPGVNIKAPCPAEITRHHKLSCVCHCECHESNRITDHMLHEYKWLLLSLEMHTHADERINQ